MTGAYVCRQVVVAGALIAGAAIVAAAAGVAVYWSLERTFR